MEQRFDSEPKFIANFMANNEKPIGHLVALKVAGQELKQDFKLVNPMAQGEKVPACGMITSMYWDGEPGGKIILEGRVPYTNKGTLASAVNSHDKSAECEVNFTCYDAEGEKTYYKCWHTGDAMIKGKLIRKECSVDNRDAEDFRQIKNYRFTIVFQASDQSPPQGMHLDYGNQNIHVLPFGEKVGA